MGGVWKNIRTRLKFVHEHLAKDQDFWTKGLWLDETKIKLFLPQYQKTCLAKNKYSISLEVPDINGKAWWWKSYSLEMLCYIRIFYYHRIHYELCTTRCLMITRNHLSEDWSSTKSGPCNIAMTLNIPINPQSNDQIKAMI